VINPPQAFTGCQLPTLGFNLSHASLDSYEAYEKLCELALKDPKRYALVCGEKADIPSTTEVVEDVMDAEDDDFGDDCEIPLEEAIKTMITREVDGDILTVDETTGTLGLIGDAETTADLSELEGDSEDLVHAEGEEATGGRPKRLRRANPRYLSKDFWQH
jgi:hypothetical protein